MRRCRPQRGPKPTNLAERPTSTLINRSSCLYPSGKSLIPFILALRFSTLRVPTRSRQRFTAPLLARHHGTLPIPPLPSVSPRQNPLAARHPIYFQSNHSLKRLRCLQKEVKWLPGAPSSLSQTAHSFFIWPRIASCLLHRHCGRRAARRLHDALHLAKRIDGLDNLREALLWDALARVLVEGVL